MVGLSRARFYQLLGSAFPFPLYDVKTQRPFYTARTPGSMPECPADELRNRRQADPVPPARQGDCPPRDRSGRERKTAPDDSRYRDLLDGLKSLGMAGVTAAEVEVALKTLKVSDSALKDERRGIEGSVPAPEAAGYIPEVVQGMMPWTTTTWLPCVSNRSATSISPGMSCGTNSGQFFTGNGWSNLPREVATLYYRENDALESHNRFRFEGQEG